MDLPLLMSIIVSPHAQPPKLLTVFISRPWWLWQCFRTSDQCERKWKHSVGQLGSNSILRWILKVLCLSGMLRWKQAHHLYLCFKHSQESQYVEESHVRIFQVTGHKFCIVNLHFLLLVAIGAYYFCHRLSVGNIVSATSVRNLYLY